MKKERWVHGLELDGLRENNMPFKIIKKDDFDNYLIEEDIEVL